MKTHIFIFYSIITLGILSVSPLQTHAQSIFVTTQEKPLHVGNTSLVTVMIDTGKAEINAIEGDISVNNSKDITWINTGGSVFTLWPQKPSLESGHIVFVGGTPNTVYGTSLKTFTFAYKPSSTKSLKISFKNSNAYLGDGKGTKITLSGKSIEIPVIADRKVTNELATLVNTDIVPPLPFTIELGKDASVNNGRYFVSFYTQDMDSGIQRYEVTEGLRPPVRSGNVYVLQNQNLTDTIEVSAIDAAGNIRTEKLVLEPQSSWQDNVPMIAFFIILLGALYFFILKKQ